MFPVRLLAGSLGPLGRPGMLMSGVKTGEPRERPCRSLLQFFASHQPFPSLHFQALRPFLSFPMQSEGSSMSIPGLPLATLPTTQSISYSLQKKLSLHISKNDFTFFNTGRSASHTTLVFCPATPSATRDRQSGAPLVREGRCAPSPTFSFSLARRGGGGLCICSHVPC